MSISDLNQIKRALLDEHQKLEVPNPEDYRDGILVRRDMGNLEAIYL